MGSQTARLALTHYDGGDSPKWVGDNIPSYNSDMLKIDEWAAKIDPIAGANDTRPNPTIIGASDITNRGVSETFARADHRHGILMGETSTDVAIDGTTGPGSALSLTRSDHTHKIITASAVDLAVPGSVSGAGTGSALAKANHTHQIIPIFGITEGTFCEGNDSRFSNLDNAITAIENNVVFGGPDSNADSQHTHTYPEIDFPSPIHEIKSMDTKIFNYELNQGTPNSWTWYSGPNDFLYVENAEVGDILDLQGILRSTSPATSVGIALTFGTTNITPNKDNIFRMFTCAYGGQSGGVSIKYKLATGEIGSGLDEGKIKIWLGFITSSDNPIHTRITGNYPTDTTAERYTALSYTLYSAT
jgi:hypothetical protein